MSKFGKAHEYLASGLAGNTASGYAQLGIGAGIGAGAAYATDKDVFQGANVGLQAAGLGMATASLTHTSTRNKMIDMAGGGTKGKSIVGALAGAAAGQFIAAPFAGDTLLGQTAGYVGGTVGGAAVGGAIGALSGKLKVGKMTNPFRKKR